MTFFKTLLSAFLLCGTTICQAQNASSPSIIPLPAKIAQGEGVYTFKNKTTAWADAYAGDSIKMVLKQFQQKFTQTTGLKWTNGKKMQLYN